MGKWKVFFIRKNLLKLYGKKAGKEELKNYARGRDSTP